MREYRHPRISSYKGILHPFVDSLPQTSLKIGENLENKFLMEQDRGRDQQSPRFFVQSPQSSKASDCYGKSNSTLTLRNLVKTHFHKVKKTSQQTNKQNTLYP